MSEDPPLPVHLSDVFCWVGFTLPHILSQSWPLVAPGSLLRLSNPRWGMRGRGCSSASLHTVAANIVMNSHWTNLDHVPTCEPITVAREMGCSDWPELGPVP